MPGFFHIQFPHINRAKLRPTHLYNILYNQQNEGE